MKYYYYYYYYYYFLYSLKMSKRTLKFDDVEVNKEGFHALSLTHTYKIVISEKYRHFDRSFKYFVGHAENGIIRLLCFFCLKWADIWNILIMMEKCVL